MLVRDEILEKAGGDLDALEGALADQQAFADLSTRLLRDLDLLDAEAQPEIDQDETSENEGEDETQPGEEIGRASGRERVCQYVYISVVDVQLKIKNINKQ